MTQAMYDLALNMVQNGFSVIPIQPGTKRPLTPGLITTHSERHASAAELHRWFIETDSLIGIVCGPISGNLLVFDFDDRTAAECWLRSLGWLGIENKGPAFAPIVLSPRGMHVYIRTEHPLMQVNRSVLARRGKSIVCETRGWGSYVVAPPSQQPNGDHYALVGGLLSEIPIISQDFLPTLIYQAGLYGPEAGAGPYGPGWPAGIPAHAKNVRAFNGLWLWEFGNGSQIELGLPGPRGVNDQGESTPGQIINRCPIYVSQLKALLKHFDEHRDRYMHAIEDQEARDADYDTWIGPDGDDDEWEWAEYRV